MTDKDLQPIAWRNPHNDSVLANKITDTSVDIGEMMWRHDYVPLYTLDQAREIIDKEKEERSE